MSGAEPCTGSYNPTQTPDGLRPPSDAEGSMPIDPAKLSINGNFGEIGRSIGSVASTGLLQGQIDFTLFDRDRNGEEQEIASRVKRIDDQIADLRRGIEEDLREALLNLDSSNEQVAVAREGQQLAGRELELAQDRFQSGTAN